MIKEQKSQESYVRIVGTDIKADLSLLYGFAKIKGVSISFSNAMCKVLNYDKNAKISSLSDKEIERLEAFLSNPIKEGIPAWLLNSRNDVDSGENLHFNGKDIEFNLMQLKRKLSKIRTYRGQRLRLGLTVRGQRTKSNFRKNKMLAAKKAKAIGGKK